MCVCVCVSFALIGIPCCISCISLDPQAEWSDRLYDRPASAFGDACAFLLPVLNKVIFKRCTASVSFLHHESLSRARPNVPNRNDISMKMCVARDRGHAGCPETQPDYVWSLGLCKLTFSPLDRGNVGCKTRRESRR